MENPVKSTLVRIALAAQEEGLVNFLLVGGNAVIAHGVPRFTRDVDFLIPAEDESSWRIFLERQGLRFGHGTPGFSQFFGPSSDDPRVDLMLVDPPTWEKLIADAREHRIAGAVDVRLPSPLHLIAMKLSAAVSPQRVSSHQDWGDVVELVVRHGFSLEDSTFREFVIRFGGSSGVTTLEKRLHDRQKP